MPGSRALALTTEQTAAAARGRGTPRPPRHPPPRRGGLGRRLLHSKALPRLISPVVVLAGWQFVSSAGLVSAAQAAAADRGLEHRGLAGHHQLGGLRHAPGQHAGLAGAGGGRLRLGAIVALVLAVIAGLSRLGENAVDPLMQMLRTLPLFGLIPVFIVWFGIGELPKVLLIAHRRRDPAVPEHLRRHPERRRQARRARPGARACAGAS